MSSDSKATPWNPLSDNCKRSTHSSSTRPCSTISVDKVGRISTQILSIRLEVDLILKKKKASIHSSLGNSWGCDGPKKAPKWLTFLTQPSCGIFHRGRGYPYFFLFTKLALKFFFGSLRFRHLIKHQQNFESVSWSNRFKHSVISYIIHQAFFFCL